MVAAADAGRHALQKGYRERSTRFRELKTMGMSVYSTLGLHCYLSVMLKDEV